MRTALLLIGLGLLTLPALAFPRTFDGDWSVEVHTTVGSCEPSISGTVTVQGGRIVASSADGVQVWGYIDDTGEISARFTREPDILRAQGRVKGATASGAWSSNTRYCGGVWTARRARNP